MDEIILKEKKVKTTFCLLFSLLVFSSSYSFAAAPKSSDPEGLRIATKSHEAASNYGNQVVKVKMILKTKAGDSAERNLVIKTLEGDKVTKSLVIFQNPPDVKGTAFLSYSYREGDDDQWIFLPAIRRVKRISSSNQDGPFMASEFAYEDMSSQEVEKFNYKFIKKETYKGQNIFVIEKYPKNKHSGYTREIVTVDAKDYLPLKVDYYDRKEALLKTLTIDGYKKYVGKHFRPNQMMMVNHQTGKSTELIWKDYEYNHKLNERDFSKNSLNRIR